MADTSLSIKANLYAKNCILNCYLLHMGFPWKHYVPERAFDTTPAGSTVTVADVFSHLLYLIDQATNHRDKTFSAVLPRLVDDILKLFTPEVLTWPDTKRNGRRSFLIKLVKSLI